MSGLSARLAGLGLRLRIGLIFAGLGAVLLAGLVLGLVVGARHGGATAAGFVQAGVVAGIAILAGLAGAWMLFDEHVARALDRLSGALRARAHAGAGGGFEARWLGDLAPAAAALAARAAAPPPVPPAADDSTRRLERILAGLPIGVVVAGGDDQVAFYNAQAARLIDGLALGQDLSALIDPGPVRAALARTGPGAVTALTTRSAAGRLIAAELRRKEAGYVIALRDVSEVTARREARAARLSALVEDLGRPAAALSALAELLEDPLAPPPDAATRAALAFEARRLTAALGDLADAAEAERRLAARVPGLAAPGGALLAALAAALDRVGLPVAIRPLAGAAGVDLAADPDALAGRIAALGQRLAEGGRIPAWVALAPEAEAGSEHATERGVQPGTDAPGAAGALLRLGWRGAALPLATLEGWLGPEGWTEPWVENGVENGAESGAESGGAGGGWALCLPLAPARAAAQGPEARPLAYDFTLMRRELPAELADRALDAMACVVLDCETTGLDPARDALVEIAALRVTAGRIVPGERFETLVDPGRPIPAAAQAVHGISDAAVAGAPGPAAAAAAFVDFARGAAIVAHNAPFDLELVGRARGQPLEVPVLDTVLLSAAVFGRAEVHTLDALAARLAVPVPEGRRHRAMGDVEVTAEVFLRLIPMLRARGIETFGQAVTAMRRHPRLLRDLNRTDPADSRRR
ncbi:3'-5' exonuclease [Frigidibacter sp. MR17.24]|uniref:3'-5' exonuclease n=1 Tax=Frigidibacter sp. MR17.24 TaxID=3127345 RepID=UPI003012AB50